VIVAADHFFQRVSEYEEKWKVAKQVLPARVNEQSRDQGPYPPLVEIVKAEDQIPVGPVWVLLPGIEAR
jgi:hypothetical protein